MQASSHAPGPAPPPTPTPPGSRPLLGIPRLAAGVVLTAVVIAMPSAGALIGRGRSGEPIEWDLVRGTSAFFSVLCALAWAGLGLFLVMRRMNRRAISGALAGGDRIEQPALVRELLAHHDVACGRCGYSLRGLAAGECPECHEPVRVHLAGADPMRPLLWATRLALTVCAIRCLVEVSGLVGLMRGWSYRLYGLEPLEKIAVFAGSACVVIGLVLLGAAIVFWLRARSGPARAVARWRVLQVSVGLVGVLGLVDLGRAMLLR